MSNQQSLDPYQPSEANFMYHLLFCDAPGMFAPQPGSPGAEWQKILFAQPGDPEAVRGLSADSSQDGRIRALAFNWLRFNGHPVPKGELLGAIIEVPIEGGLDTLAAYADGSVRYINHTGRTSIFEGGPPDVVAQGQRLLAASKVAIGKIGPWDKDRLPPPQKNIRMSFLVSDGLYFGEGPMEVMQRDAIGGPIIGEAGRLLQVVVDAAERSQHAR
jgi:hypothetical protein